MVSGRRWVRARCFFVSDPSLSYGTSRIDNGWCIPAAMLDGRRGAPDTHGITRLRRQGALFAQRHLRIANEINPDDLLFLTLPLEGRMVPMASEPSSLIALVEARTYSSPLRTKNVATPPFSFCNSSTKAKLLFLLTRIHFFLGSSAGLTKSVPVGPTPVTWKTACCALVATK